MEDQLTIDLFDQGMGPLHRAGLGGLACTLKALKRPREQWEIDEEGRRLTLRWPSGAKPFLEELYREAFTLEDGMIYLPGAYECGSSPPGPEVMAELQRGMSQTILQFGPNRKARSKTPKTVSYTVDEQAMEVTYQDLISYTHMGAWEDLLTTKGKLRELVTISGTIAPGFAQRHIVHAPTTIEQPPGHAIALHFALVGTVSLSVARTGTGALIVPEVTDLREFIKRRPDLNPKTAKDCQIVNPADAALQAQVRLLDAASVVQAETRLRGETIGYRARSGNCLAILFSSSMWNPNQKARAEVLEFEPTSKELSLYKSVVQADSLKPRLVEAKPEKKGDAPRKFWAGGIVRALIAQNLARHRPWYADFRSLVVGPDGKGDEQKVRQLSYERKGLQEMVEKPWDDRGAELLVRSIHQAMSQCFGRMWDEANKDKTTFENRYDRQMERWRLALAHAKTPDDVRGTLSDMWSRAGQIGLLQESWTELLPVLCNDEKWALNRDLGLLALASYKGSRKSTEGEAGEAGESA
jgi:CRISPR-associated protein Cas8a1/Csx13